MDVRTVGWIGLGIMGKPMARNLLRAGFSVVVNNRSHAAVEVLQHDGASEASSPRSVAERCDVVVTMLPETVDVERVVQGPVGILEGLRQGAVHIDMSTIEPDGARRIAAAVTAAGGAALDAPVSGGETGAVAGTLSIMVGGPADTFERMQPIFAALGKNIVRIGDAGAGQVAKACNQIVVAATIQAVAEALALAEACGVDPARVRTALLGGFAQSRILDIHGERMIARNFVPGFKSALHRKDLRIVDATANEAGVQLPAARLTLDLFDELIERGGADLDHSALCTLIDQPVQPSGIVEGAMQ
jgi:2-hydroxy-3-oxopropionate reductase